MAQRCEHCGQTVMASDKQCWHCGKALPVAQAKKKTKPAQPATAVSNDVTPPMPPFTTILLYAGLTLLVLLILIATTRAIGQAPLFLGNANSSAPAGWQPITDSALRFTLNLPESWHTFELEQAPEAPMFRSSPALQALVPTLETLTDDVQLVFLGAEDTAVFAEGVPVFMLVAQSQRLQQLSNEQIIDYAQQRLPENVSLSAVNLLEDSTKAQAESSSLLFNIEHEDALWRCLEKLVSDGQSVYVVVTCTSFAQFPQYQTDFETILRSFQPLSS